MNETAALETCLGRNAGLYQNCQVSEVVVGFSPGKNKGRLKENHLLLHMLKSVGLADDTLNWFQSYLTNRKQRTSVGDALSVAAPITVGVPQGRVRTASFSYLSE